MTNTRFIGINERENYLSDRMDETHSWLGLLIEGQLVGCVEFHDDGDNELFIDMIKVNASHQNKGLSKVLLEELRRLSPGTMAFTGESTPGAVPYWMANSVIFEPTCFEEYDKGMDMEGIVFPFSLSLSNEYRPYWTK